MLERLGRGFPPLDVRKAGTRLSEATLLKHIHVSPDQDFTNYALRLPVWDGDQFSTSCCQPDITSSCYLLHGVASGGPCLGACLLCIGKQHLDSFLELFGIPLNLQVPLVQVSHFGLIPF